ncbi:2-dehydro-3-deoxygalactonokinase [Amphiplicatus metriothermophilus]|uniref:2-keto-3-deoxygalactonate kinase n=1 Tax=Amphiplicatus metriothermophilus TaxID=1519374 RepID=A0A239PVR9_9PROT|nr:2-dehydro-3-deoxygalactonokinase [Amphiplicatus metriothermophilus]MBB5519645.1 2-dehydro-3-deoxygalactonokinase [Amphiplicatus metriothermophilus]SNT74208.1 2-keto-3-deoxygalactonate kinase [Amphiplicatus metriothermophilus]
MSAAILGDWGTSRMRLYLHDGRRVLDRVEGPGVAMLAGPPLEALKAAVRPLTEKSGARALYLCGVAGSRNGVLEVAYAPCPARPAQWAENFGRLAAGGLDIRVAPGLRCENFLGAPDVMRGEETQIFGALQAEPALARGRRVFVLPGTHSKWVLVEDAAVARFHTFPTGEIYALLRERSFLLRAGRPGGAGDADAGFEAGLARAASGRDVLALLFETRSAQLLADRSRDWAAGFLSGLLIGRETAEAAALLGEAAVAAVIGDRALSAYYQRALAARGLDAEVMDGEACAIDGLILFGELAGKGA